MKETFEESIKQFIYSQTDDADQTNFMTKEIINIFKESALQLPLSDKNLFLIEL